MIVCKVCGTENEQGASFCGSCGTFLEWNGEAVPGGETGALIPEVVPTVPDAAPVPTAVPQQPQAPATPPPVASYEPGQVICPACGQANEPARVFCKRCATELAPVAAVTTAIVAEAPRARSGPPVAVIGGLGAAALLGVLAVVFLLPRGTSGSPAGVSPSAPSTEVPTAAPSGGAGSPGAPSVPPPTAAPPSGCASPSGVIVFTALKGDDADLWIWDATDGSVRPLVTGPGSQSDATWSPDGTVVVYRSPDGLRMVRTDGTPVDVPDFTHHAEDRHPAWSPDGKVIVFATNRKPLTSIDIVSRLADDNKAPLKSLVNSKAADWGPAFSPDGRRIVFVSKRNGDAHLFLMKADGSGETEIKLGAGVFGDPAFSPDGKWLAFSRRDNANAPKDLYKARVDGSALTRLTRTDSDENDLTWSPDGTCIAVARADADARIVLVDAATGADVARIGIEGDENQQPNWR